MAVFAIALLALALLLAWELWFVLVRRPWIKKVDSLPGPPRVDHLLCHAAIFLKAPKIPGTDQPDVVPVIEEMFRKYSAEGAFRLWTGSPEWLPLVRASVYITDPDLVKMLLHRNMDRPPFFRKSATYDIISPLIGKESLLVTQGEVWERQRAAANRAFRTPLLLHTARTTASLVKTAVFATFETAISGAAAEGQLASVEIPALCQKLATDLIAQVAFSCDFGTLKGGSRNESSLGEVFAECVATFSWFGRQLPGISSLPLPVKFRLKQMISVLDKKATEVISQRTGGGCPFAPDILTAMLSKDADGKPVMSSEEVFDNVKTMLFAGQDTTAWVMSWSLYHLAANPAAQERLAAEVSACPSDDGLEDLDKLPYLTAVINEVLRLEPPAAFGRRAMQDVQLGKLLIPAGINVIVLTRSLHRDPAGWGPRADIFDPERWLKGQESAGAGGEADEHTLGAYMPFSMGPRNCIGMKVAMAELKAALACILRGYSFTTVPGAPPPASIAALTIKPQSFKLVVSRRNKAHH